MADLLARPECAWITRDLEKTALGHAIQTVVPEHVDEVRGRRLAWIEKARAAVKDRLIKEITWWDHRAEELKDREQAGRPGARLNSQEARRRATICRRGSRSASPSWIARRRSRPFRP